MKAVRIHAFGGPEVLKLEDIAIPTARDGEVVLRVGAAGINPVDNKIRQGAFPRFTASDLPLILGRDVCGRLEGGPNSLEVIALLDWQLGGYAEYVAVSRALCVHKPRSLSISDAAAIPLASMTAWQGLFQYAKLQAGHRVLIHAGSGGVGHFAVQFAAHSGAHVFSTASKDNIEFVRQLGAQQVIDYQAQRFEDEIADIDVVLDLLGGETRQRSWKVLRPGGILVSTLGQPDARTAAEHQVRAQGYMTEPNASQLTEIVRLIDEGKVHPVVSKTFGLGEAAEAQGYLEKHHPRGKVVLTF